MILKKNFMNKFIQQHKNNLLEKGCPVGWTTKLQNNVIEEKFDTCQTNVIEDSSSSTTDNEILRIKNIFKIGTPLPLEPSLYSPIHLLGEKKTN